MAIDTNLKWFDRADDFSPESQKVLLALSSKKWLWRSFENLEGVTRLSAHEVADHLRDLMDEGLVRGSVSKEPTEAIFGLVERVGPGRKRRVTV